MTDAELIVADLRKLREGLYDLLRSEAEPSREDANVTVQQGMALQARGGEGNKQLQIVNVTYNRTVHLKAIELLRTVDNAMDNARALPARVRAVELLPCPPPAAPPVEVAEGAGLSLADAYSRGVGLKDFMREARIAYVLYVRGREGTQTSASKVLKVQRTYLSRVLSEYKLKEGEE